MTRPIAYIDRMLEFHADEPPYRWAEPGELPSPAGPPRPARESTVVLVSLAGVRLRAQAPFDLRGDTTIRLVPLDAAPDELTVDHFGFKVERAAADVGTVAPLAALRTLAADGEIAGLAPAAVSAMGATYSQRRVATELAPAVVEAVGEQLGEAAGGSAGGSAGEVDPAETTAGLALIVPACPLDHQTAGIVARALEAAGVRTLVLSGARDISCRVGAPRTVYLHAPLGWLLGLPGDADGQRARLAAAVAAGAELTGAGELVDLDPAYPTGATGTPHSSRCPDLADWEAREYTPGYDTGVTR